MAVSLPDDVVLQILKRVKDVAALFRCATACTGWRRLFVDDPSFVRRCLSDIRSSPFPGFFVQHICRQTDTQGPCLIPPPRPVFGSSLRFLGSFIPNLDDPAFFNDAVPLVSRHGLLLLRLYQYSEVLCVCNLLAGTFNVLPCLQEEDDDCPIGGFDDTRYALLAGSDLSSSINDQHQQHWPFKVLVLGTQQRPRQYLLRTFSSTGERRWNMCSGNLKGEDNYALDKQHNAVVCNGAARWLFSSTSGFYTLDVSTETCNVSFTDLELPTQLRWRINHDIHDEPHFSVDIDGRLVFLCLADGIRLEIWTQHNNGAWTDSPMLELTQPERYRNRTYGVVYTFLGEKNGTLVIKDDHYHVYIVDVNTWVMQEVTSWPRRCSLICKRIVPLEMDWLAFFTSRLGVDCRHVTNM